MLAALAAAVAGTMVGAVTPTAAYRLSTDAGSPPRSACARCARPFPTGLPGWVRPGARCPGCRTRHGPRVGWTATAGAGSFGLLTAALAGDPALPAFLAVAGLGVLLAAIDLACLRLPDPLVGSAALIGVAGLVTAAAISGTPGALLRALAGALCWAGGYVLLAMLPGSRLGFGDVKLAGVLGLLLGWLGWHAVLLGLILPHLINGPLVLILLLTRRARRDTALPLGPALLAGALLAAVLG